MSQEVYGINARLFMVSPVYGINARLFMVSPVYGINVYGESRNFT